MQRTKMGRSSTLRASWMMWLLCQSLVVSAGCGSCADPAEKENEKVGNFFEPRGIGEVEAESVALMIGAAHGMDTSGYTIPYVSTWAARVDAKSPARSSRPPVSESARRHWESWTGSTPHK